MILYHFCPAHMLSAIVKEGLTKGKVPFFRNGEMSLLPKTQWLTTNPDFDQAWAKYGTLPYSRTDYRITINIPKSNKDIFPWLMMCEHPLFHETAKVLNSHGDPQNWFIFKGRIKPGWFRAITRRQKNGQN